MAVFCKTHRTGQRHHEDGCYWFIDYYVNGRRKREAAGASRRFAERALGKRRTEIREGHFFDKRPDERVTWDAIAEDYLKYSAARKRSHAGDVYVIEILRKRFGGKFLREITPGTIETYVGDRLSGRVGKRPAKPATVNRQLACLKTMFNLAIKNRKATVNPVREVKMLQERNARLRFLSRNEIGQLLACCPESIRPIVVAALYTGMRKGELIALRWQDVDLEHGFLRVEQSKSGDRRDVPVAPPLDAELRQLAQYAGKRARPEKPVFDILGGRSVRRLDAKFHAAVRRAGIEDFRFHDLRHTAASYMVMGGTSLAVVREILGHKTMAMTLRYSHLSREHKATAVLALTKAYQGTGPKAGVDRTWTHGRTPESVTAVSGEDGKGFVHNEKARVAELADARDSKSRGL